MATNFKINITIDSDLPKSSSIPSVMKRGLSDGMRDAAKLVKHYAKNRSFKNTAKPRRNPSRGNYTLRRLTGNLRDDIYSMANARTLILGAGRSVDYARIHELGGVAGNSSKIPARPFLRPVIEDDLDEIAGIIQRAILKSWGI